MSAIKNVRFPSGVFAVLILLCCGLSWVQAATPLAITGANYNKNSHVLVVNTTLKGSATGLLTLLHSEGGMLAQLAAAPKQTFTIPLQQLGAVPCRVEVRLGDISATKAVTGAAAECAKVPTCQILSPLAKTLLKVNTDVEFKATAKLTDSKAKPLTYEWDFNGGVMGEDTTGTGLVSTYKHSENLQTKVKFVRDNSVYRVRFAATDSLKRRCEAAIEVTVGIAPSGLPAKVPEQPAPMRGQAMPDAQKIVVIPFQEWSMQNFTDMRTPRSYLSFIPLITHLNAYAFEKGSVGIDKPRFVGKDTVALEYSAAANPFDPAGANSINSTSQNWPVNADSSSPSPLMAAKVQKTDLWESYQQPASVKLWSLYQTQPIMQFLGGDVWRAAPINLPRPDEGYFPHTIPGLEVWGTGADWIEGGFSTTEAEGVEFAQSTYDFIKDSAATMLAMQPAGATHGQYMPGVDQPYTSNDPQPLPKYDAEQQWHSAPLLPITDVSDDGRVNPYPLMRVAAVDPQSKAVVAKTDGVLSNSRDFHCRDCHAKGKIAANPNAGYKKEAFLSSAYGQSSMEGMAMEDMPTPLDKPKFFSVEDIGGNPNSLFDQEYAASLNFSSLHQFYDGMGFLDKLIEGNLNKKNGLVLYDYPLMCIGCHMTALKQVTFNGEWSSTAPYDPSDKGYDPNYSISMHRFHGEMQYNATKTDIVRNDKGAYQRWDWAKGSNNKQGTSLFPIFDANGKQLPMEENCLRCHAGHREQIYNDRMKTAGVTCYDCHGDMGAVGQAFTKKPEKAGSKSHADYRIPWFDETDCGSCHIGTANLGKEKPSTYFSAGVKKRAFADSDLAAITLPVDKNDPDAVRFAVVPHYVKEYPTTTYTHDKNAVNEDGSLGATITDTTPTKIDAPVYRFGKDQHGIVACAACHGPAHSIGPNRDPKANDNITALQLQGYPGQIYECNVCHTQDAFKTMDSIGSSLHYPNTDGSPTILAGPHNLHPVNDPNWWQQANGDEVDSTPNKPNHKGIIKGGWHNDWAKLPGINGEDQCAACHGTDHKGTRLSKVPVDRELTTETGKKIIVKAGTPVSCALCHTLQKSCTGSPVGKLCGTLYAVDKDCVAPLKWDNAMAMCM